VELDSKNKPRITWILRLLTSGDLIIKNMTTKYLDVSLVGGGGGGSSTYKYTDYAGSGGGGGYVTT